MNQATWDLMKPIAAQALRDLLRTVGMGLLTHGAIANGAGVEAFIGAGMTLGGLFWGWFTTTGYLKIAGLLKKLTDTHTQAAAVVVANQMAPAAVSGIAVDAKADLAATTIVKILLIAFALSFLVAGSPAMAAQVGAPKVITPSVDPAPAPSPTCFFPIDPLKLCGKLTGNIGDDLKAVVARIKIVASNDIDYAILKATAANTNASKVRLQCLQGIKVAKNQFDGDVKDSTGAVVNRPDPALITGLEDIAELADNLSPQGALMTSCAGAAQMFKMTALQAINAIVTGAAGIAALPAGL